MSPLCCLSATISYKGTHYFGFQKTKMGPSIQQTLEEALTTILRAPIRVKGASRTDRGVHAKEQIIYFLAPADVDLFRLLRSLNQVTPQDIAVDKLEFVDEGFEEEFYKRKKEYHYSICNGAVQSPFYRETSWHFFKPLDVEKMRECASHFLGKKDFSALTNRKYDDSVRHVESIDIVSLPNERLEIRIIGDRFLYKMVRNIVGTLVYVGCEKIDLNQIEKILENKLRKETGVTAPAHGLSLYCIVK